MKTATLHALIRQHIPSISFIDEEITDAIEAECTLWQQEDTAFIMDFDEPISQEASLISICQNINQQLAQLDLLEENIRHLFAQQSGIAADNASLQYVAFFVEDEHNIFCDFALTEPSLGEKLAEMSLENDNEIIFHGIES